MKREKDPSNPGVRNLDERGGEKNSTIGEIKEEKRE